jgi:hypothetical protein
MRWVLRVLSTLSYPSLTSLAPLHPFIALPTTAEQVIRTRLRQPAPPGQSPRYTSLLQSFRLVLLEEGWRALYGGLSPHLLRVVPNAVTMYWVYERVIATFVVQKDDRSSRSSRVD